MRTALVVAMGVVWALAVAAWPGLPERMPCHFDFAGRPDRWTTTSGWAWFALPALGTALGILFGFMLPRWMVALARANSRWLNVPHKAQFAALPAEARERAIRAPLVWLRALACCVQGLLGWIVFGSARVADGRWQVLPSAPAFGMVGALLGCAVGLAVAGSRAVRREVERT